MKMPDPIAVALADFSAASRKLVAELDARRDAGAGTAALLDAIAAARRALFDLAAAADELSDTEPRSNNHVGLH